MSGSAQGVPFEAFPKIARWEREVIITEKIDGTNAQVLVTEEGDVIAGSRNRFITPEADNHSMSRGGVTTRHARRAVASCHTASGALFKRTLGDDGHKGEARNAS